MPGFTFDHGMRVHDAIDLEGYAQASLSISSVAAQTAALAEGIYDLWVDTDCFIKVAATANDVTTASGYLLRANNTVPLLVRDASKIGAITSAAAGTLRYHKVG